jgi:hypothetical protein
MDVEPFKQKNLSNWSQDWHLLFHCSLGPAASLLRVLRGLKLSTQLPSSCIRHLLGEFHRGQSRALRESLL